MLKGGKQTEPDAFSDQLRANGFKTERDLDEVIKKLEYSIKRSRNKLEGKDEPEPMDVERVRLSEIYSPAWYIYSHVYI